jgi:ferritin-like metal-binding protein YciE
MGQDQIVRILSLTQSEEEDTDQTLGEIAEWSVNEAARAA